MSALGTEIGTAIGTVRDGRRRGSRIGLKNFPSTNIIISSSFLFHQWFMYPAVLKIDTFALLNSSNFALSSTRQFCTYQFVNVVLRYRLGDTCMVTIYHFTKTISHAN